MTRIKKSSASPQAGKHVSQRFKCLVFGCCLIFAGLALRFHSRLGQAAETTPSAIAAKTSTTEEVVTTTTSQLRNTQQQESNVPQPNPPTQIQQQPKEPTHIRLAFVGNSLLYYNDCPGMLAALIQASGRTIEYDACMRGGASFSSIQQVGCAGNLQISKGPLTVLSLIEQHWDYIIFQDQSRAPAQLPVRRNHVGVLKGYYLPSIHKSGATPIFLQTAGYKNPRENYETMTRELHDGYHAYADAVKEGLDQLMESGNSPILPRVSPVGEAYHRVYQTNRQLWKKLYMDDGLHPTPRATWMQACVLFGTIFQEEPPEYDPAFWEKATHGADTGLEHPTLEEAKELRQVAIEVMAGVGSEKDEAVMGRL